MANNAMLTILAAIQLSALADGVDAALRPDGFTRDQIQQAHEALTPTMCLLNYSLEITNASSGEVNRRSGYSLGLLVSEDGLIMTNGHLIMENRRPLNIKVRLGTDEDGKEYDARVLKKPDDINVTFLRIQAEEGETFPYVKFGGVADLELGESVLLFGVLRESLNHARGLQLRRIGAVLEEPRKTYCLDAPISFGYVGGPVVNSADEIVGVLGFDLSSSEGGEIYTRSGHPLIFQSGLFAKYIENPPGEETSNSDREDAWLGIYTQPLTDDLATYWKLPPDGGMVVTTVVPGSPAERSGLRPKDVIIGFNDTPITAKQNQDVGAFTKLVRESPLDAPLPIHLYRDGESMDIRLTLLPRPKSVRDASEYEDPIFGLTVRELTTDVRLAMNLSDDVQGVLVRRVKSGSPASLSGLRPAFLIMAIGGRPITNLDDYQKAVEGEAEARSPEITLFCRVGANTAFFRIQPRWE